MRQAMRACAACAGTAAGLRLSTRLIAGCMVCRYPAARRARSPTALLRRHPPPSGSRLPATGRPAAPWVLPPRHSPFRARGAARASGSLPPPANRRRSSRRPRRPRSPAAPPSSGLRRQRGAGVAEAAGEAAGAAAGQAAGREAAARWRPTSLGAQRRQRPRRHRCPRATGRTWPGSSRRSDEQGAIILGSKNEAAAPPR